MAGHSRQDRCTARRRDGERCEAHAIPGGNVCEQHGGSARQVKIAARHRELQFALVDAVQTWRETGDFDDLCKVTAAQRAVAEYEAKLELLSELRRSLAEKRAAAKASREAAQPAEPTGESSPGDALYGSVADSPGTTRPSPFV
jgi:hypothetical protein